MTVTPPNQTTPPGGKRSLTHLLISLVIPLTACLLMLVLGMSLSAWPAQAAPADPVAAINSGDDGISQSCDQYICGDGVCAWNECEGTWNCPADCQACGDGICHPDETCWCSEDCGDPPRSCFTNTPPPPATRTPEATATSTFPPPTAIVNTATEEPTEEAETEEPTTTATATERPTSTVTVQPSALLVVVVADPPQIDAPGGLVTFRVTLSNTGEESLQVTGLSDSLYGDVGDWQDTTCTVPRNLAGGESYECVVYANVSGEPGDTFGDTIDANGESESGSPVQGRDSADVTVTGEAVAPPEEEPADAEPDELNTPSGFSLENVPAWLQYSVIGVVGLWIIVLAVLILNRRRDAPEEYPDEYD